MANIQIQPIDTNLNQVNSSTEESILLLRRIAKLLESQAVTSSSNRQKVQFFDYEMGSAPQRIAVSTISNFYNKYSVMGIVFGPAGLTSLFGYDSRWFLFDIAANSYSGMRSALGWS